MARSQSRSGKRLVHPNYAEIVRRLGHVQEGLDRTVGSYLKKLEEHAGLLKGGECEEADRRHCFVQCSYSASVAGLFGSGEDTLASTICLLERFPMWRRDTPVGRDACTAVSVSVLRYLLTDYVDGLVNGRLVDHPDLSKARLAQAAKDAEVLLANARGLSWGLSPSHVEALGL